MTTFTLHIGAGKAGSTAIQGFIRRNHLRLADHGFVVPDRNLAFEDAVSGHQVPAVRALAEDFASTKSFERTTATFTKLADEAKGKKVLISAENLSNGGNARLFEDVCQRYEMNIVLYIRRQDDLLSSAWQQWHSKVEEDFNAWIIRALKSYGHWDKMVQAWSKVATDGGLKVRIFARSDFVGNDLLADFADAIGIDDIGDYDLGGGAVNASHSDIITPLVAGNKAIFDGVHDNRFSHMIQELLEGAPGNSKRVSLLTPGQRDSIVQFYREGNNRVRRQLFPERRRLFAPVDHSKYDYLSPEEMTQRQLRFLTEALVKVGLTGERAGQPSA